MELLNFNYNVSLNTINCINEIDFTHHIIREDYPYLHTHNDFFEFTFLLEGSIVNIRNGIEEKIEKKTLFIGRPNESHFFKKINNSNIKILNIIARENKIYEMIKEMFKDNDFDFFNNKNIYPLSDSILYIVNKTMDNINSLNSSNWKTINSLLNSLINVILNSIYIESSTFNKEDYDPFISKLNDLKSNKDFYKYCVNDLCYKFDYSRTHLNRLFNEYFNMSPFDYLEKCKMEYVESLLLYTDYSIKEISYLIGYNSVQRLTKNFKEYYLITPSEYKKKH